MMNGPKVRKLLSTRRVSKQTAHKMLRQFLDEQGPDEIILSESLTRLGSICQSLGGESGMAPTEPKTPMSEATPKTHVNAPSPEAQPAEPSPEQTAATKHEEVIAKEEPTTIREVTKKEEKKKAKSAKKEKKLAKKERKQEKRKRESEASSVSKAKKAKKGRSDPVT